MVFLFQLNALGKELSKLSELEMVADRFVGFDIRRCREVSLFVAYSHCLNSARRVGSSLLMFHNLCRRVRSKVMERERSLSSRTRGTITDAEK